MRGLCCCKSFSALYSALKQNLRFLRSYIIFQSIMLWIVFTPLRFHCRFQSATIVEIRPVGKSLLRLAAADVFNTSDIQVEDKLQEIVTDTVKSKHIISKLKFRDMIGRPASR